MDALTWKDEPAETAMEKAKELVKQYVMAGFTKIHIDTSMHLGDDNLILSLILGLLLKGEQSLLM